MTNKILTKQPSESDLYDIDFAPLLKTDDDIASVTSVIASPSGLTIGTPAFSKNERLNIVASMSRLAARAATRRRRWSAYVHQSPPDEETAAIRRSNETGLPFGEPPWVNRLAGRLNLDLTIRPRGRPKKQATRGKADR